MSKIQSRNIVIHLKGRHSRLLIFELGNHKVCFKVLSGRIRINHGCYTPDGGTWLDKPNRNRQAYYDICEGKEKSIGFSICKSFGHNDKIIIVNPQFMKETLFEYQILE